MSEARYNHTIKIVEHQGQKAFYYKGVVADYIITRLLPNHFFYLSRLLNVKSNSGNTYDLRASNTGGHADFDYWHLEVNGKRSLSDIARDAYGPRDMAVNFPSELYACVFEIGDEITIKGDSRESLDKAFSKMVAQEWGFYSFSDHPKINKTCGPLIAEKFTL